MTTDRLKIALENFVTSVLPNFDYYALNPGTIIAPGSGDNLFDFQPDNASLPGLQDVEVKTGMPGVTITINPVLTPRCYLGFEGGNPAAPYLALWAYPGLLSLQVDALTSINLNAPVVALGPAWTAFLTATSTATMAPQIASAAATLLTLIQALQGS